MFKISPVPTLPGVVLRVWLDPWPAPGEVALLDQAHATDRPSIRCASGGPDGPLYRERLSTFSCGLVVLVAEATLAFQNWYFNLRLTPQNLLSYVVIW